MLVIVYLKPMFFKKLKKMMCSKILKVAALLWRLMEIFCMLIVVMVTCQNSCQNHVSTKSDFCSKLHCNKPDLKIKQLSDSIMDFLLYTFLNLTNSLQSALFNFSQ